MAEHPVDLNALRAQLVGGRPPAPTRANGAWRLRPAAPQIPFGAGRRPGADLLATLKAVLLAAMALLSLGVLGHSLRAITSWWGVPPVASEPQVAPRAVPRPRPSATTPGAPATSAIGGLADVRDPGEGTWAREAAEPPPPERSRWDVEPGARAARPSVPAPAPPPRERMIPQPPRLLGSLVLPDAIRGFMAPHRGERITFIVTVDAGGHALEARAVPSGARIPAGAVNWLARALLDVRWDPATGQGGEAIVGTAVVSVGL